MKELMIQLHNEEDGATATEYLIVLVLIAVVIIGIIKKFGVTISDKFAEANEAMTVMVRFN